jgi:opacity protein-like surface antigen
MRTIRTMLLTVALFSSGKAVAQDFSAGPYLRASGSVAFNTFTDSAVPLEISDPVLGVNASVGYRFAPYFALEAEGEWLDTFRTNTHLFGTFNIREDVDIWATTLNAKAFYPIGRVHPFLAAGIGAMHASLEFKVPTVLTQGTSHTDFAARFSAGAEVYVWENLAVVVDGSYVLGTGGVRGFNFVRAGWGLQYRFPVTW